MVNSLSHLCHLLRAIPVCRISTRTSTDIAGDRQGELDCRAGPGGVAGRETFETGGVLMATESSGTETTGESTRRGSRWILGPWRDLLLFVATPFLVLPLGLAVSTQSSGEQILFWVLAFGALGHHVPGLLRAYGDRELFQRFRWRFIVVPLVLLPICGLFFFDQLVGMKLVVLAWGLWHFLMQTYGFARIYDGKSGGGGRISGWLDWSLCIAWFGAAVLHSPRRVGEFLGMAYQAGLPVDWDLPVESVRGYWVGFTVVVTVLSLGQLARRAVRGMPVSLGKVLLLVISFSFFWYCTVNLTNLVLGIAMFEIFHDIQYLAIVWSFNRRRVDSGAGVGAVTRFLFRNSGSLAGLWVGLYVGLVLAYGSLSVVVDRVSSESLRNLLYGVIATSSLLHFYYDGFIWKVRESSTRRSLGMSESSRRNPEAVRSPSSLAWRHWMAWVVLASLVWVLFETESRRSRRGDVGDLEMARAVVAHVPGSVPARIELARTLINSNQFAEAASQAEVAIRLEPSVYKSYVYRGVSRIESGQLELGWPDLLQAERRHARDAYLQYHMAMALLQMGREAEAVRHLESSRSIRPGNADVHYNLGVIRLQSAMRRSDPAALVVAGNHFREAVQRDPQHAYAVCMVGEVERQLGRSAEAIRQFRLSLLIDASLPEAHHGLSLALRATQSFDESNRSLSRAVYHALLEIRAGSGVTEQRLGQAVAWSEELVERSGRSDWASHELLGLSRAAAGDFPGALSAVQTALESRAATGIELRRRLASQRRAYQSRMQPELPEQLPAAASGG
jgi:tetratricopeptide (TPR) repeat protein